MPKLAECSREIGRKLASAWMEDGSDQGHGAALSCSLQGGFVVECHPVCVLMLVKHCLAVPMYLCWETYVHVSYLACA